MIKRCQLETDGYLVIFDFKSIQDTPDYMDLTIEFKLDKSISGISVKSIPNFISKDDLQDIIKYFKDHIARLQKEPARESHTFITYGLGFQIKALSGYVESPDYCEFSLLFLVNVGKSEENNFNTYVGGESIITLNNVQDFIGSLQAAISDFEKVKQSI